MNALLVVLTVLAALGSSLIAGVFFAFSSFVMKGLRRLEPAQGVAAMQAINVAAVSFLFMFALFGTAVLCVAVGAWSLATWNAPSAPYLFLGTALYLLGVIGMTIVYHVPRNDALAKLEPAGADTADYWGRYSATWTAWNHVRAASALACSVMLGVAVHVG